MFTFLRSIGLEPLEFLEARKLTRKPLPYIGEILDTAFQHAQAIVVLLTADDEVRLAPELQTPTDLPYEKHLTRQARPNVLFEAGMALASHPGQTILVQIGEVRPFSDITGRHLVHMDNSTQKRQELASRLEDAGCSVNLKGTDWHTDGNMGITVRSSELTSPDERHVSDVNSLFWSPHLWENRKNYIVITEPWFFRDISDRYYIRHFGVNEPNAALLLEILHNFNLDQRSLKAVHHYVSIGEVEARDVIADGLRKLRQGIPISFLTSHGVDYAALLKEHMILTGTSRASSAIQNFQIKESSLLYKHCNVGVERKNISEPLKDCPGKEYLAIVSRIADTKAKYAKTVIACNHGPATCAIAKRLFSHDFWPELIGQMRLKKGESLPDCFQILLKVPLSKDDETVSGPPRIEEAVIL